jgi:hypothetical protein
MDYKEIRSEVIYWIYVVQDKEVWQTCTEHSNKISGSIKCREFLD